MNPPAGPPESLSITDLGPFQGKHTFSLRRLTVFVGPQASGKSLALQSLYCLRGIKALFAERFNADLVQGKGWPDEVLKAVLDDVRGVPFGYFANGTARLSYEARGVKRRASVYQSNRRAKALGDLATELRDWASVWSRDPKQLASAERHDLFIPTERSTFNRLSVLSPKTLYEPWQPEPLRSFAEYLQRAGALYDLLGDMVGVPKLRQISEEILSIEEAALGGRAYLPRSGEKRWKWRVAESERVLPLEAISSGQSEAWPVFVILATYGAMPAPRQFYIEEPEAHLHPRAQLEVLNAIACLLERTQSSFVVATHSPFFLAGLNNLLQHERSAGTKRGIPSDWVSAYRLSPGGRSKDVLDRDETGLIDAAELEETADQLGSEFEDLLLKG